MLRKKLFDTYDVNVIDFPILNLTFININFHQSGNCIHKVYFSLSEYQLTQVTDFHREQTVGEVQITKVVELGEINYNLMCRQSSVSVSMTMN